MPKEQARIRCQTFQKQEPIIKDITEKINLLKDVKLKAIYAEELQKEVDALLSCADYDSQKLDCKNCRFIANLRKKTAELIKKAKKLT